MEKNNEICNLNSSNNSQISEEKTDTIQNLLENEQELLTHIKKIFESEFEELFIKILNLPKIDFLNQLTSNVTSILSEQFSSKILENEKFISLITSTCHSFDKTYNRYMEELTEGWDLYNLEKLNQIQDKSNQKIESFFFTKFRKHCHKTQNYALHKCNKEGDLGHFIIVCGSSQNNSSNDSKNKIKYLICDNCRKSFFVHEFDNFCEYCSMNYLCGPLIKDENKNFLVATLNPPHCETFVNEELICDKCKNKLYIDIQNNKLKCGNAKCDYCISIENNNKINFKCKICENNFSTNVKIYNPIEVVHFKTIIDKALLYRRKAYPGKLSCCSKIKEKKTDFYHKKDCKGKIYFAECNHKVLIVCSKCRAVNQYSKFIWTCPECGIHFRDKKSQENEMKIRKTKSTNKLTKSTKFFPQFDEDNYLTLNSISINKRNLAEVINMRKNEKNFLFNSYNNFDSNIANDSERKKMYQLKVLSEQKSCEIGDFNGKNSSRNDVQKKRKRKYILGKILPWGTPKKKSQENEDKHKNSERKKEYYDKKVNDIINPKQVLTEINLDIDENNNEEKIIMCKTGRANYKYETTLDSNKDDKKDKDKEKEKEKEKPLNKRKYNGIENHKNNYDSYNDNAYIHQNHIIIETNNAFNKKMPGNDKNIKKDNNDLKCKKFVPVKLKYANEKEGETKKEKNKESINDNTNNNNKLNNLIQSQKFKKINQFDINSKKDNVNQIISLDNRNNKESWLSKETTAKGSVESKNSNLSHSPPKEEEEETKRGKNNKIFINHDNYNYLEKQNLKIDNEDDIIPADMVDPEEDIIVENQKIKDDKYVYDHIQRRLKKILKKGRLPRFDLDKFSIDKQIGDGSFGIIYLIHNNKSKKKYAMKKIIANNINSIEIFQKEFEIAHNSKHPSITDIKGIHLKCFETTTFVLYVLMDLAEKDWEMEINERQKRHRYYREKELTSILKQLSSALYFLQKEKNVAHRDVKPENVLLFKGKYGELSYKLCDFGEAKDYQMIHNRKQKTLRGTELYMSPALYNGLLNDENFVNHNAYKSDVFSLGCCMIIAASLDFDIINEIRLLEEQAKIEQLLKKKLLGKYSEKFIDVVLKMINFNEKERIDFIQLEEIIKSTFK